MDAALQLCSGNKPHDMETAPVEPGYDFLLSWHRDVGNGGTQVIGGS